MAVLDAALPDGVDIVVDAGNIGASAIHYLPVRRDGRFIVALGMGGMGYSFGAGVGDGVRRRRAAAHGRHRRRRLILHARHGDSHRAAVPAAGDVPAVRQPRPRDVRDPRAAVLRRPVQLQPVRAKPARRRAGRDVPRPAVGRRRRHRRSCPLRCARRWTPTARRWSASNARPTKSRRSQTFSATPLANNRPSQRRTVPMSLPALDDITAHRGTAEPIDGRDPHRDLAPGEGHPDHHGDDAVGVPARRGVRRVLHRQRLHRLSARRAVRLHGRHPLPGGVDLQPARVHADRGTRAVAGLRPAGLGDTRSTPARSPTGTR